MSGSVIVLRDATNLRIYILLMIVVGTIATVVQVIMGSVLFMGLQKEKPAHLRHYLIVSPGVITLNMLLLGSSSYILHWVVAIPSVLGMAAQIYFLLVIRSAYKEMLLEERVFAAARHNL